MDLAFLIPSVSRYYGTQSDIWVKSYCRLISLRALVFNFERLDILRDTIGHPRQKLLSVEFAKCFCFQFQASRYITRLYPTSELKVIVVWFFLELPFSITSVSIYYRVQSDIRVKSYCRLIFLRASVFYYERLDTLRDTIRHLSKKLLSFDFSPCFSFQFRASRYITGLNQTSE